ncbi:MAG: aminoacyl-tRNA hydrolase [Prolixibacteraceae bacterium]|jgi:PTH1 family peptidyl-tRNA hydrolase|nr:aminoacyl-tRNA hydrolase [Prolixibacteraceae bacterium]
MKYLIVGLGNIGEEYKNTRHNIGFRILDALAGASNLVFNINKRYGAIAEYKFKGRTFILLKPATYMNLSGNAVRYWLQKEKIPLEHLLVIVDDLALPLGAIRVRGKGGDAGHNGLKHINEILGTNVYTRVRFGIGSEFNQGQQIDYVLGEWDEEEEKLMPERIDKVVQIIKSFGTIGLARTMNQFNNK